MKDNSIRFADHVDDRLVETTSFEPFEIESMQCGSVAGGITIRWHILGNHRARADDRARADAHELMNADQAPDDDKVFNDDVPTESRAVGNHVAVADDTVMGNMTMHHQ